MPKRILVIDDDPAFRSLLEDLLTGEGYEVTPFASPVVAAGDALSGNYDLITLDLKMPEAGGVEIAELFKDQALKTPVLVISGFLEGSIVDQLRDAGIEYTLSKPFRRRELIDTVEAAIAS